MTKIENITAGRITPGMDVILVTAVYKITRVSRKGSDVTLFGYTRGGATIERTVNAFQQIQRHVPINDLGKGLI